MKGKRTSFFLTEGNSELIDKALVILKKQDKIYQVDIINQSIEKFCKDVLTKDDLKNVKPEV